MFGLRKVRPPPRHCSCLGDQGQDPDSRRSDLARPGQFNPPRRSRVGGSLMTISPEGSLPEPQNHGRQGLGQIAMYAGAGAVDQVGVPGVHHDVLAVAHQDADLVVV